MAPSGVDTRCVPLIRFEVDVHACSSGSANDFGVGVDGVAFRAVFKGNGHDIASDGEEVRNIPEAKL